MRAALLLLLLGPGGLSQAPSLPDEAFFKGDPLQVMQTCMDRAVALAPGKARVLAQAGRVHLFAKDRKAAEACFERALLLPDVDARRIVGQAWLETGAAKEGVAILLGTIDFDRSAKNHQRDAAIVLMDQGHPKEAEAVMTKAFENGPRDWSNVVEFSRACLRRGRQDLAGVWLAKVAVDNRKQADFWCEVALALAEKGAPR